MPRTIVDVHVVQTVPPSNLNRDDTGSPKTATYGGKRRARVSSQAWKRATRDAFDGLLDPSDLGVRTKRVVELVADEITTQVPALRDRAPELATAALGVVGIKLSAPRKAAKGESVPDEAGYLLFLGRRQVVRLAELAVAAAADGAPAIDKKAAKLAVDSSHAIDVALFGRMVADVTDLNVDAAVQVAHALSVHAVDTEYDYFTAVDDHKKADADEDAGAAMIGTVEFNSATLYRYATVDVDRLRETLGDVAATRRAVEAFVEAFVTSMPTGKQNTFANRTLPDAVLVVVRETQSINLVGAYEEAVVEGEEGGRVGASLARLARHGAEVHHAYDEVPVAAWWFGVGERAAVLDQLGERSTIGAAVAAVGEQVVARAEVAQ